MTQRRHRPPTTTALVWATAALPATNGGIPPPDGGTARRKDGIAPDDERFARRKGGIGGDPRPHRKKRRFALAANRLPEQESSTEPSPRRNKRKSGTGVQPDATSTRPALAGRSLCWSYAASSSVSSVVDWLLFALGTKRCFMSSTCSWSLAWPAGVLSTAYPVRAMP